MGCCGRRRVMDRKIVFGRWESIAFLVNAICMQTFLNFPRIMVESAATAGWLLSLYISVLALISFAIILKLYRRFEGKDIIDVSELAGGSILRIITGLVIIMHIAVTTSIILREFGEDMKVIALEVSPISFVEMFFVLGMVVGAYVGIEAIVRFHSIVVPIIIVGYLVIILGVAPYYDFRNLFPVLGLGWNDVFIKGAARVSSYSALILLFVIVPFLKTYKNLKIVGYWTIGLSTFFLTVSVVALLAVLPYPVGIESFLPIYQLARLISLGRFFQRIESVFVLIWAAAALLYLSSGFFVLLYVIRKTFKLEYYKPLIIPCAIIIFTLSLLPESLFQAVYYESAYIRNIGWLVTLGLVIIILSIGNIRRKGKKKEAKGDA